jgi:hypothetical protein
MMPARRTSLRRTLASGVPCIGLVVFLLLGLGRSARADNVDDLIHALLVDQSHKVRTQAAIVLGNIGGERAVRPLIEALRDTSDTVRGSAAASLGKLGDRRAVDALAKLKNDASSFVQQSVAKALQALQAHDKGFGPPTPGAKFYVAIRGTSTKLGGDVGKALREALLDEVKRLPRISVTIDGPPTAQLLASRRMVGYSLDGNVTSMKHSGDQLDCDVQMTTCR